MKYFVLTLLVYLFAKPALALELALPVACVIGKNCWVQQYFDHDASAGATDYTCGVASYDGHDGTDIRVLNTSVTVNVLAAASGVVKAVRDGVADNLVKTVADKAAVDKIECGNGVVITHESGWETQYCHMRNGSVVVKAGVKVAAGAPLGAIGYSGNAAFPHLHVTVRKDAKNIDPFSSNATTECSLPDRSLWNAMAHKALAYKATEILQLAWAPRIYDDAEVETGKLSVFAPSTWSALVLFAEVINLYKDDVMTVTVLVPGQEPVVNTTVMKRNRALQRLYVGKKLEVQWPQGVYKGHLEVKRRDAVILAKDLSIEFKG